MAQEQVEQVARDAAAEAFETLNAWPHSMHETVGQMIRAGKCDDQPFVQAVAALATPDVRNGLDGAAERKAYRMAYAPLRSAQHALDIIADTLSLSERDIHRTATVELAKAESERLEAAIRALDVAGEEWTLDIDNAPFDKKMLVYCQRFKEVCEAIRYRQSGWLTFGPNGAFTCNPSAYRPLPAPPALAKMPGAGS